METKRTVTIDLCGQRLTVRTTEPPEELERHVDRVHRVLEEIQARTPTVDTVRLFALGLLHLGREINVLESNSTDTCRDLVADMRGWSERVRRTLND